MRIKKHLMVLAVIGHQPECTACAQLGVRKLDATTDAVDEGLLSAPVKLKGFALLERKGNEHTLGSSQAFFDLHRRANAQTRP